MGQVTVRKLLVGVIACCAIVLGIVAQAHAEWTGLLRGYDPRVIAINPNNTAEMYVGDAQVIFYENFTVHNYGDYSSYSGGKVTYHYGVFKTINGGKSWSHVEGLPKITQYLTDIMIDPVNPRNVYATYNSGGGVPYGLYKSTDYGATWSVIGKKNGLYADSFGGWSIVALKTSPQTLLMGTYLGIYRSTNGGASWNSTTNSPGGARSIAPAPSNVNIVYAVSNDGVYKSSNAGISWSRLTTLPPNSYWNGIVVHPTNPKIAYVSSYLIRLVAPIYKTIDGGVTWQPLSLPITGEYGPSSIALDKVNPQILYVTTTQGAFKSTTGGTSWTPLSRSKFTSGSTIYCSSGRKIAIDPKNHNILYYLGILYNANLQAEYGVFKSTTGGV
jgi:hypothetical protein